MKLTQLAEGIAKKGKFDRLLNKHFKAAPHGEIDPEEFVPDTDVYYPKDGIMVTHNARDLRQRTLSFNEKGSQSKVTRIAVTSDEEVHVGYETGWLTFSSEELNSPSHTFVLWKKTNY